MILFQLEFHILLLQASKKGLVNIDTQWLFMITDSNDINVSERLSDNIQVKDGYNVAFIYNASSTDVEISSCQVTM